MAGKLKIKAREGGSFFAVIGDEDTVTGFLLAGVGNVNYAAVPGRAASDERVRFQTHNFLVVDSKTQKPTIEAAFKAFSKREDIAVILINQHIADDIRYLLDEYQLVVPTVLEIPSKDKPYDLSKDFIMGRLSKMLAIEK